MRFKPETLAHRVILKPFIQTKTDWGLELVRDERSQAINTNKGEVVHIGPCCWFDKPVKPDLKPGDKVYYAKYGAMVLKDEETGELYIIANDEDVLVGYDGNSKTSEVEV